MNLKYLLFALGFFMSVEFMPAMDGGLKNYQCSKCATVVKSDHTPSSLYCRASGGSHQWNNLGEVGMEVYSCKKCGTWLESKRTPSSLGCPAKGSHQWNHLGRSGNNTYQCRKCGLTTMSAVVILLEHGAGQAGILGV